MLPNVEGTLARPPQQLAFTLGGPIPGAVGVWHSAPAPSAKGRSMEAFTKRGRGAAEPTGTQPAATGLRVATRGETPRPPVRLRAALRPQILRGAVRCRLLELKHAVPIAPQPLVKQSLERSIRGEDVGICTS
jgi:hypothetical protein